MDSTGVLVRYNVACRKRHFYVVIAEDRHILFQSLKKNDGDSVAEMGKGFSGYCLSDASAVFHALHRREDLVEVGCWAHARRKFFDALSKEQELALIGIGLINRLFDVQRDTYDLVTKRADTKLRRDAARPILRALFKWMRDHRDALPDGSPVRRAINYIYNHKKALCRFLRDGRLRLDNNISELELRRTVVGRKNWLFFGADSGAEANCVATSLIASCKMHGIEPWAYLRELMWLLPSWSQTRVLELAPANWAATRERVAPLLDRLPLAQLHLD